MDKLRVLLGKASGDVTVVLIVLAISMAGILAGVISHAATATLKPFNTTADGVNWNPNIQCRQWNFDTDSPGSVVSPPNPAIISVKQLLGTIQNFKGGAAQDGGQFPAISNWRDVRDVSQMFIGNRQLTQACVAPMLGDPTNIKTDFVEMHNLRLVPPEPFINTATDQDTGFFVEDPQLAPLVCNDIKKATGGWTTDPACYMKRFHAEISGPWKGVQVPLDADGSRLVDYNAGDCIDIQGFVFWDANHVTGPGGPEAFHFNSGWEIHPMTAWRRTPGGCKTGSGDSQKPTAPTGLAAVSKTATSVNLAWNASTDNVGVTGYDIFRNGTQVGTTAAGIRSYNDTGLTASTAYTYTVKAEDAVGNTSAASSALSVTTNATTGMPDLVVTAITWTPATPGTNDPISFSATVKNQGTAATPGATVHRVAFSVDGTLRTWSDTVTTSLAAGASRNYTASGPVAAATWTATSGTHTILAEVDDVNRIDESNESNNSLTSLLTVADRAAPTVSLSIPLAGNPVATGTQVSMTASAADDVGIVKVEFYKGASKLGAAVTAAPFSHIWNTTGIVSGTYKITAKAYDAAGNTTVSNVVNVVISSLLTKGDVDGNGRINAVDMSLLISHYGQNYPAADFDRNGTVDAADEAILKANWTW